MAIGSILVKIGADTKGFERDLKRAEQAMQRTAGKFTSVGQTLSLGVTAPLAALGLKSLSVAGDIEALQKGLISVMGSAEMAADEFKKLIEVAKLPGLGLEEAVQGSVALQAAGFSADEARASLLAFGNALATVGKGKNELKLVNLALTQMQNKSSGFGQEIRQLTEQLPQLRGALQSAFGTSESDQIAKLGITGKEVVAILTAEFAKLPKVAGGLKNSFENAGDAIKIALFNVGDSLNKTFDIEGIVNSFSEKIENLAGSFANLDKGSQKLIFATLGITAAIGPAVFIIGKIISAYAVLSTTWVRLITLAPALRAAMTVALGPVGLAVTAIAVGLAIIIKQWDRITDAINRAYIENQNFRKGVQIVSVIFSGIYETVSAIFKTISNVGLFLKNVGSLGFESAFNISKTVQDQIGKTYGENIGKAAKDAAANILDNGALFKTKVSDDFKLEKTTDDSGGGVKVPVTPVFDIPGAKAVKEKLREYFNDTFSGEGFKFQDIFTDLNKQLALIDDSKYLSLISSTEAATQKTDAYKSAIQNLSNLGFGPLSDEIVNLQTEMRKLAGPETFDVAPLNRYAGALNEMIKKMKTNAMKAPEEMKKSADSIQNSFNNISEGVSGALNGAFNLLGNSLDASRQKLDDYYESQKQNILNSQLSEEQKAEAIKRLDNSVFAEKRKIARKEALLQKAQAIFQAALAGAQAVISALKYGPIYAGAIGALAAAQIAAIASQKVPSLAIGTDYVNRDGLAMLHKGEKVVPADVVSGGYSGGGGWLNEVYGKISGIDILLSNRYASNYYNRLR